MSDSVRPHRRQPTRLPRPWDSPGKNTGVSCHFLLQCMKVKEESEKVGSKLSIQEIKIMASSHITSWQMKWSESHSVISNSPWPHGLYSPWNPPGQNTGVGSLSLPQGSFTTQGSNPALPHCRRILYQLSHKESLSRHMTNRWGKSGSHDRCYFLEFQKHCRQWLQPWN